MALDARLPARRYGGTERVVTWLAKGLAMAGHKVTLLCAPGSTSRYATVIPYDPGRPVREQVPDSVDVLHLHRQRDVPDDRPVCVTHHGTTRNPEVFHQNTIFISADHARRNNGSVFIHHGLDPDDYPPPDLRADFRDLTFLAKASWRVKNVRGAVRIARLAKRNIHVLGGHRVNFSMGFRLTLDPRARFHGMVDDTTKGKFLRDSSGLVFPVLWHEPFGVAVIEAMFYGTPTFATPFGSLPELVTDDVGALSGSCADLAAAIQTRRYSREAIHERWRSAFTIHHMTDAHVRRYSQLMRGISLHPTPFKSPPTRDPRLFRMTA
ncbi:MAG: glycosyltransferase [Planctomycetaceae bacterium]